MVLLFHGDNPVGVSLQFFVYRGEEMGALFAAVGTDPFQHKVG